MVAEKEKGSLTVVGVDETKALARKMDLVMGKVGAEEKVRGDLE